MSSTQALLVIDMQQALFEKSTPIYQAGSFLDTVCTLVDQAHQSGTPVVFIQHENDSFLAHGSAGWQLHPQVQPGEADLLVFKKHGNAFEKTPLHQELQARGVTTVIITGLVTHGCVKATCQGAKDLGYHVILVSDGHSNYHKKAAAVIAETNQALSEAGIELRPMHDISFA